MNNVLWNYITDFGNLQDSQHCLVKILKHWKNALDKGDSVCALFMDLSNFDIINHDLLLAKLKAYNFSKDVWTLMCSYLKNCKQRLIV